MHDTMITEGCLGVFSPKLQIRDIQTKVFMPSDSGPFYLSDEQKECCRHDQHTEGNLTKQKNKNKLTKDLQEASVSLPVGGKQLCTAELQALAQHYGVALSTENPKIIPGWQGKAKGILQILWECGLIAESSYKRMTLDGKKQLTGHVNNSSSLQYLLGQCTDFKNELNALQVLGKDLGVIVNFTPKYHAKCAGEGIEYSWGYAKGLCNWAALAEKQGRSNFL